MGITVRWVYKIMEVIRECDIFNDDSAEIIEVEEKPKNE